MPAPHILCFGRPRCHRRRGLARLWTGTYLRRHRIRAKVPTRTRVGCAANNHHNGVLVPQAAGPTTTPTKFSRAAARRDVAPRWSGRLFPASTMRVRWRCISGGRDSGHALPQKRQMTPTHLADNVQDDARARGAGISGQRSRPSCIRGGENV